MIVVGAVYDLRNEMKRGNGSVNIVNVNGHTEPAKIAAFLKALAPTSILSPAFRVSRADR